MSAFEGRVVFEHKKIYVLLILFLSSVSGSICAAKEEKPEPPDIDIYSYRLRWIADAKTRIGYAGVRRLLPFCKGAGREVALT
jgi:hypothetical protein